MRRRFRHSWILWASLALASPSGAEDDAAAWVAVPAVPELLALYEDPDREDACPPLGAAPTPEDVACWSAYVARAVSEYPSPIAKEERLACVSRWRVLRAATRGCRADAARCVQPAAGLIVGVPKDLPIRANVVAASQSANALARHYTAFQILRNAQVVSPHRRQLGELALSQGLLVLHHAYAIDSLRRRLAEENCGPHHVEPYFALASRVIVEIGGTDLPQVLATYPPPAREWARDLYWLQLEVLSRPGGLSHEGDWVGRCRKATDPEAEVGALDADINAWCGYAYAQGLGSSEARAHWHRAAESKNHVGAADYARESLARIPTEHVGTRGPAPGGHP